MQRSLRDLQRTQSVSPASTMHLSLALRQFEHAFCFFSRTIIDGGEALDVLRAFDSFGGAVHGGAGSGIVGMGGDFRGYVDVDVWEYPRRGGSGGGRDGPSLASELLYRLGVA